MFAFQVTSVWLTTAMLFVQTVCPGLTVGCSCKQTMTSCCSNQETCCFGSREFSTSSLGSCPHCNRSSESDEPECGFQQDSVCHCGDFIPVESPSQVVPETTSSLEHLLALIVCTNCGVTTILIEAPAPIPPPVPSSEELTHNYTQIVLCVWLT